MILLIKSHLEAYYSQLNAGLSVGKFKKGFFFHGICLGFFPPTSVSYNGLTSGSQSN